MKKLIFTALFILALVPGISQAHILKIDNDIGVTIHVNPDDDPIVGQAASFFLEIKDKTNKFQPANCACTASIIQNGKTLFTSNIFSAGTDNTMTEPFFSYTFPAKGVYTFKVDGQPKSGDSFQKFSISYDLRVERVAGETKKSSNSNVAIWVGVGVAIFAAIAGAAARGRKNKSKIA